MKALARRRLGWVLALCVGCASGQKTGGESPRPQPSGEGAATAEPANKEEKKDDEHDLSAGTKKPPVTKNAEAIQAFVNAAKSYKANEGKGAIPQEVGDYYRSAAGADEKLGVAWYNLAVLAENKGNAEEAEQHYRKALSLDPTLELAVDNLGALLERQGQANQARKLYGALVDKNPRAVNARVRMGALELADGDAGQALVLARQALAHEPRSLAAYRLLSRSYLAQKQLSLAKLMALRGLKIDAEDPEMTVIMGEILIAEKDPAAGLATMQKAVAKDGQQLKARYRLATAAFEARDYQSAAEQYEEILRRDPKASAAAMNLGLALQGQGRFTEAKDVWSNALSTFPDVPEFHYALGDLYLRNMNNYPEAKKELKAFISKKAGLSSKHPAVQMERQVEELIRAEAEAKRQMELLKKQEEEEMAAQKLREEAEAKAAAEAEAKAAAEAAADGGVAPAPAPAQEGGGEPQDAPPAG